MIALAWLSLITMLILSLMMDLQAVTCFTFISPLPINNMPNTDIRQKIASRETAFIIHPHTNNVMKGQKTRKSFALGVGFGGGGGMMKKSSGGFGGGGASGGFGSNSMGTSSFG